MFLLADEAYRAFAEVYGQTSGGGFRRRYEVAIDDFVAELEVRVDLDVVRMREEAAHRALDAVGAEDYVCLDRRSVLEVDCERPTREGSALDTYAALVEVSALGRDVVHERVEEGRAVHTRLDLVGGLVLRAGEPSSTYTETTGFGLTSQITLFTSFPETNLKKPDAI